MLPTVVPVNPDRKVRKVQQEARGLKDQQVQPDHKVLKDQLELPALQGRKGRREPSPTAMQPVK
jgi:hypothetical protein